MAVLASISCDEPTNPVGSASSTAVSASAVAPTPVGLTQTAVDQVVASHRAALAQACAADVPRARTLDFQIMMEIDVSGSVIDAAVAGGGSAERPLRQCVEKRAAQWKFPAPGAPRDISAALSLGDTPPGP